MISLRLCDGRILAARLSQHQAPRHRIHLLRPRVIKSLRRTGFAKACFQIRPRAMLCTAEANHIAPVTRIHRETSANLHALRSAFRRFKLRSGDTALFDHHLQRLPAAHDAQGPAIDIRLHQFLEDLRRSRRLDGFRAAEGIPRSRHAIRERIVRTDTTQHLQEESAARKVGARAVHHRPFIRATHTFSAELSAKPIDVIHQHDLLHAESRRLHRRRAGGFIATDNEQISLNDLGSQEVWQE